MKEKVWIVTVFDDDNEEMAYAERKSWTEAVIALLFYVEKDIPFGCSIDFIYRDGERE